METTPDRACPTPTKKRFATTYAAGRSARMVTYCNDEGKIYYVYLCPCGWHHLTTKEQFRPCEG